MNFYWKISLLLILNLPKLVLSQGLNVKSQFSVNLKTDKKTLLVSQKIKLTNNSSEGLIDFFLTTGHMHTVPQNRPYHKGLQRNMIEDFT